MMKNLVVERVCLMKKIAFSFLLLGCFASIVFAQPSGYRVAENEISVALPVISQKNKNLFKAEISRKFADKKEERLLKIAEAVYPTAEEKAKNCSNPVLGNPSNVNWACGSFDNVLVLYAVTKSAVICYLKLTDDFRKDKNRMKTSSLTYSAEIKFHPGFQITEEKFTDVYVVSMKLGWSNVCGDLCALMFNKDRTVVLDKNGKILFVDGDGETPVMVS